MVNFIQKINYEINFMVIIMVINMDYLYLTSTITIINHIFIIQPINHSFFPLSQLLQTNQHHHYLFLLFIFFITLIQKINFFFLSVMVPEIIIIFIIFIVLILIPIIFLFILVYFHLVSIFF